MLTFSISYVELHLHSVGLLLISVKEINMESQIKVQNCHRELNKHFYKNLKCKIVNIGDKIKTHKENRAVFI